MNIPVSERDQAMLVRLQIGQAVVINRTFIFRVSDQDTSLLCLGWHPFRGEARAMTESQREEICGFIVVRMPHMNMTSALPNSQVLRTVDGKRYSGVDRN